MFTDLITNHWTEAKEKKLLEWQQQSRKLINSMLNGHTVHMIYNGDKSKAPLVVYQNYLQAILLQKTRANEEDDALI